MSTAEPVRSVSPALTALSLSMLLASLGTSIANVGLPALAQAFNASFQQVQWIVLAYLLAVTTLIVSAGRLGDVIGRRRLLLAGIVLFTAASALCGAAPALWLLIAACAAQGLGAAVMMALTMAFVGETVPKAKTGSAMGLLGTMSAVGTALGPSLGGVLIAAIGWRAIFFVSVPLGLVTLLLAHRYLPVDRDTPSSRWSAGFQPAFGSRVGPWRAGSPPSIMTTTNPIGFDGLGTLLFVLTLTAYALGVTAGRGDFNALNAALLVAAIVGLCLFMFVEAKASSPLIPLAMLRNSVLSGGFATTTLVTTVVMATLVVGPFYLSGALALDAAAVGLAMSAGPIVAALTGVPAGRIVDRFGAYSTVIAGLIAMAAGASMLPIVPLRLGVAGYIVPLAVLTAGYALFQAANNTAVMAGSDPGQRGVVSGMLNLSRNLGLITGASVMGAVFALGSGTRGITTASPEAIAAGMRLTFALAAVLIVAALVIAWASHAWSRRPFPTRQAGHNRNLSAS